MALAFLILALGGVAAWERALLRTARSPRAIEIVASGTGLGAVLVLANGETVTIRALRGIGVTRHWVALSSGLLVGRSVLVTMGMLGPRAFRILRLWALWDRIPSMAAEQLPV